mmetsp:Transcript_6773/g.18176  ORF Transcript_6773/g.18176 Transcript_6773/m.18176 type:complete len:686 (+) Transcript_6773:251-2308(+)|eukprot:CAMPEP_0202385558 /NCGR_PEP_ID=MMETSP1127-20130417/61501_1 /ASSEMBLY_ACC=CAM_ASM_000462 /TAXON_ID=3047 /ORGANISM="Dunaliella tertiolecta, Strain CCMP1320" /LENGTH=685 /DNA_ID=CAMNT_0048985767 /DNA_START=256 /DNA_END=2313 /DNA_ORIENTATION=+
MALSETHGLKSQWACRLACQLIKSHHGEITETVCRQLVTRGLQTLPDIIRGCDLSGSQVKQALLLLIQHNYASVYTHKDDENARNAKPPVAMYEPNVDVILQILRRPRILLHLREEQGVRAEQVGELMLEHGRITYEQLASAMAGRMECSEQEARHAARDVLMALINFRCVERAPPCNLPPPIVPTHPNATKRRTKSGAGSAEAAAEEAAALKSLEELKYSHLRFKIPHALAVGAFSDAQPAEQGVNGEGGEAAGQEYAPNQVPAELMDTDEAPRGEGEQAETSNGPRGRGKTSRSEDGTGGSLPPAKKARVMAGSKPAAPAEPKQRILAGTKKAEASGESALGISAKKERAEREALAISSSQDSGQDVLWRLNYEELNRRFRHACCVRLARSNYDEDTATVMEAMLAAGRSYETKLREERGANLSVDQVQANVRRIAGAKRRAQEDKDGESEHGMEGVKEEEQEEQEQPEEVEELCSKVSSIIGRLCADPFEPMSYASEGPQGSTFCVNMSRIIDQLKLKELEAVARDRYGAGGLRIFRLLFIHDQLEQKQVADMAMLPPKDTRELLYRMLQGGFVFLQDIPKTSDRAASRTFYTWHVEWEPVSDHFSTNLYRAAGNVWARLQHEMAKNKELLDLVEEAQIVGQLTFNITQEQRLKLGALQRTARVLEASLIELDEMIALFNSY